MLSCISVDLNELLLVIITMVNVSIFSLKYILDRVKWILGRGRGIAGHGREGS